MSSQWGRGRGGEAVASGSESLKIKEVGGLEELVPVESHGLDLGVA